MTFRTSEIVLVTGAAGFIASHLIEELLKTGQAVIGIDNFDPFYPKEVKKKNLSEIELTARKTSGRFTFIERDLNQLRAEDLRGFNISKVIHLAAKAGVRPSIQYPDAYVSANIQGTVALLEFCRQRKVTQFCFGSSSSVYGNGSPVPFRENAAADAPVSPYAATKRSGELFCRNYAALYGMKFALLRFFTVYGPRQRPDLAIHKFTGQLLLGKPLAVYGDGSSSRDYTYVSDIAQGILASLRWLENEKAGACELFNLGGAKPITLVDLIQMLEKATGCAAKLQWMPKVQGEVDSTFADLTKSEQVLGYRPQVLLEKGLSTFVEWYRRQNGVAIQNPQGAAA